MDYQELVDQVNEPCAVLSVLLADSGGAEIRVMSRNGAMASILGENFSPGMPYSEEGKRNLRFEEFCCRAVKRGQSIHDYTYVYQLDAWGEILLIPLRR